MQDKKNIQGDEVKGQAEAEVRPMLGVKNEKLRELVNQRTKRSFINPWTISSVLADVAGTALNISAIAINKDNQEEFDGQEKDLFGVGLGLILLATILQLARLIGLRRSNRNYRHYFFARNGFTGDTGLNAHLENFLTVFPPVIGLVTAAISFALFGLSTSKKSSMYIALQYFALLAPLVNRVLGAWAEDRLSSANNQFECLYELRQLGGGGWLNLQDPGDDRYNPETNTATKFLNCTGC